MNAHNPQSTETTMQKNGTEFPHMMWEADAAMQKMISKVSPLKMVLQVSESSGVFHRKHLSTPACLFAHDYQW